MAILKQNKKAWVGNGVGVEDGGGGDKTRQRILTYKLLTFSLTPMKDNNTFARYLGVFNPLISHYFLNSSFTP